MKARRFGSGWRAFLFYPNRKYSYVLAQTWHSSELSTIRSRRLVRQPSPPTVRRIEAVLVYIARSGYIHGFETCSESTSTNHPPPHTLVFDSDQGTLNPEYETILLDTKKTRVAPWPPCHSDPYRFPAAAREPNPHPPIHPLIRS